MDVDNYVSFESKTVTINGQPHSYNPVAVNLGDWCPWNHWTPILSNSDVLAVKSIESQLTMTNSLIVDQEKLKSEINEKIENNKLTVEDGLSQLAAIQNELTRLRKAKGEQEEGLELYSSPSEGRNIVDRTTMKPYLNDSIGVIWLKCFGLSLGTPIVQTVLLTCNVVYRLFNLLTLVHFWKEHQEPRPFTARLVDFGADLLRVVAAPLALVGLELAALYGLFNPRDGRKLYATIERAMYGDGIFAPCFQPDAHRHLFGADINQRNGW